ncbi:MOSC domain-containing protein [Bradyrhizobium sp. U87765 SZCCT0131]|uniref:MOSC domain-containing protein n=1 Tax=unclassified Bradyrhizobium TaxID=2631580 RepID=UPI001BA889FC|nr:MULTISPECIES: MOSC N-terminal beta barrel domain-containing protein [unclassified Bradyrhizobium]MBR1221531.1 MOSC domain-containing protein [Bradyrhizobium sp. U87765 SZCCT0131]MBR1264546.1 MOSC domain-containing protein [Bradyrhizobium sp. U87765 SZCCT0134]MBR1304547.1 MOSC domain-containing protein [Bradyrhizobium sp. U87765 SZCCT0110]MBR1322596.1 MOSC domain-containing protein [Bradyrhizobium sp. U87765 SZCCT0109]MBR1346476.1 MOSC domain-containing protein [Bradyrhizobium sp. U87765 SZC
MKIREIWLYPVKGLRGRSVPDARVEPWGLAADRRWMVVDASGRFVTQRKLAILSTIGACLSPDGLLLSGPDGSSVKLRVPEPAVRCEVSVWDDHSAAVLANHDANTWISRLLDGDYRLVYMESPGTARPVDPRFGIATDRVSFADEFPLLLVNKASLDDLNARLEHPVDIRRFRANVVVEDAAAWAEDGWRALEFGGVRFRVAKPCSRCAVITIDQEQGRRSRDNEPLRTLATFRRNARGEVIFGQYLIPDGSGRIRTGDAVRCVR